MEEVKMVVQGKNGQGKGRIEKQEKQEKQEKTRADRDSRKGSR
jgi:hypothetical protein